MLTAPSKPTRFSSMKISSHAVGVAGGAGGDEVPAVERMAHRPMAAEQAGAGVLADHLHALDVGAVDVVAELADELHDRDALPFHVRAVEVEADDAFVAGLVHEVDVIAGRFDVAHGPFAGMAFQIEGDAVLLARVPDRAEALDEQFQADLADVGNRVAADAGRQRREQEEVAPAMGRRADEAGQRDLAVLQLAEVVGQADAGDAGPCCACSWISLPTSSGTKYGIGARRLVALVAPGLVRRDRLAADELQRLGARLIAQGLALQVGGDGEDFQAVLLGQVDAFLGVGLGAGVGVALVEVEFPARFFPAVEAGVVRRT